jgi:hypothetical protein
MPDFTKLAAYLNSFSSDDNSYDLACYIKSKIAQDTSDPKTINNTEDEELGDNDITMSTPDQQSESNTEGELMSGAFREFDALNKLQEEKDEISLPAKKPKSSPATMQSAGTEDFPGVGQQHNQVRKAASAQISLFDILQSKLKR